ATARALEIAGRAVRAGRIGAELASPRTCDFRLVELGQIGQRHATKALPPRVPGVECRGDRVVAERVARLASHQRVFPEQIGGAEAVGVQVESTLQIALREVTTSQ